MMKKFTIIPKYISFALLLGVCTFIISCSKNNSPTTKPKPVITYTPEGLWIGTYTHNQDISEGEQYIAFTFKADSTVVCNTGSGVNQNICKGTWVLIGDSLAIKTTTVYAPGSNNVGTMQLFTAKFDTLARKITNGLWEDYKPSIGSGTFKASFSN